MKNHHWKRVGAAIGLIGLLGLAGCQAEVDPDEDGAEIEVEATDPEDQETAE